MKSTNYKINAEGKSLGRVAGEVAVLLMGKERADFAKNTVSGNTVSVENASKVKISEKKLLQNTHSSYSGYPGGLTKKSWSKVAETKGYAELLRHAIKGMLPVNKLRARMLKNLTITE